MLKARGWSSRFYGLLGLLMIVSATGGCSKDTYSSVSPDAYGSDASLISPYGSSTLGSGTVAVHYAQDIQPLTGAQSCKACHQGGGGAPKLALGTYQVDSTVKAATLRSMLVSHGALSSDQLAKVDAWIQAGRPQNVEASVPAVVSTPVVPSPAPVQNTAPSTPASSFTYALDVQPFTGSHTCKTCHQGGGAPQLNLGTYAVDSTVKAASLRSMLASHGAMTSAQLAKVDAWIQAGRPLTGAMPVATPSPLPSDGGSFKSPHVTGWKWLHGFDVKLSGGYQYARIKHGGSCTNCHTAERLPDGSIPASPGSKFTCFSCHNGPTGGD